MKKILLIILVFGTFISCKKTGFLDDQSNNVLNEATVFTDSVNTMSFLTRIYDDEPMSFYRSFFSGFQAGLDQSTDDSECGVSNPLRKPVTLYLSTETPDYFPFIDDFWQKPWADIRRCNLLLQKLPSTPLSAATQKRVAAETRFLRAWYYHFLLINFGGVPIIGDKVYTLTDEVNPPRNT